MHDYYIHAIQRGLPTEVSSKDDYYIHAIQRGLPTEVSSKACQAPKRFPVAYSMALMVYSDIHFNYWYSLGLIHVSGGIEAQRRLRKHKPRNARIRGGKIRIQLLAAASCPSNLASLAIVSFR